MNVVERSSKRPLMVVRECEASDKKKRGLTNVEISSESETSTDARSYRIVYRNQFKKLATSETSNAVPFIESSKNDRAVFRSHRDRGNDRVTGSNLMTTSTYRFVVRI